MVNYQNGKIYKIINETNDIVYIGSTTQPLSHRYSHHKHKAPNHKIILIENYHCNSKEELCMKEQEFIEQNTNLLNKYKAYCSEEDYKEYKKEWRENHKKYNKEYRENNKKQIKEKTKEYYENNKTEIKEWKKEYYEDNKEKINKEKLEKINCEFCNCLITKSNMKKHQQSKKCLNFQNVED